MCDDTSEPIPACGRGVEVIGNQTLLLFPALHRLEEAGWLKASWGESDNNRRAKYYRLTKAGQRQLKVETESWQRISIAITTALKAT